LVKKFDCGNTANDMVMKLYASKQSVATQIKKRKEALIKFFVVQAIQVAALHLFFSLNECPA